MVNEPSVFELSTVHVLHHSEEHAFLCYAYYIVQSDKTPSAQGHNKIVMVTRISLNRLPKVVE